MVGGRPRCSGAVLILALLFPSACGVHGLPVRVSP